MKGPSVDLAFNNPDAVLRIPVHWIHRSGAIGSTLPGGLDPGFRSHWIQFGAFPRNGGSNGVEHLDLT